MAYMIPESWRQGLTHLRHDLHQAIDRWWHRHGHTAAGDAVVPVRRTTAELVDHNSWPLNVSSFFSSHLPSIDVEESDDDIVVTAELPGLEKEDFTVDVSSDRWLRIRGEKKRSSQKKTQGATYAECRYGTFARSVPLPCKIDADQAKATYQHGALTITLPKTGRAKSRRIKIQAHE